MLQFFQLSYLVREYDEAIAYFTTVLGFVLLEETNLGNGKRWVRVAPKAQQGAALLLAKAMGPEQSASIGKQGGARGIPYILDPGKAPVRPKKTSVDRQMGKPAFVDILFPPSRFWNYNLRVSTKVGEAHIALQMSTKVGDAQS